MIGGYQQSDGTELWFWAFMIIGIVGLAESMTWKWTAWRRRKDGKP